MQLVHNTSNQKEWNEKSTLTEFERENRQNTAEHFDRRTNFSAS